MFLFVSLILLRLYRAQTQYGIVPFITYKFNVNDNKAQKGEENILKQYFYSIQKLGQYYSKEEYDKLKSVF